MLSRIIRIIMFIWSFVFIPICANATSTSEPTCLSSCGGAILEKLAGLLGGLIFMLLNALDTLVK